MWSTTYLLRERNSRERACWASGTIMSAWKRTFASCATRCAALAFTEAAAAASKEAENTVMAAALDARASGRLSSTVLMAGPISAMRDEKRARLTATSSSCSTYTKSHITELLRYMRPAPALSTHAMVERQATPSRAWQARNR